MTLGLVAGLDTRLRAGHARARRPRSGRPVSPPRRPRPSTRSRAAARSWASAPAGGSASTRRTACRSRRPPSGSTCSRPTIETCRALWAPGTKAYDGERVRLPETTSYPRPAHDIPIIVGGSGERRTLAIAARLGDACNLPSDVEVLTHKLEVLDRHLAGRGPHPRRRGGHGARPPGRRARPRGRVGAGSSGCAAGRRRRRSHGVRMRAPSTSTRARYAELQAIGVSTVFVGVRGLESPDDVRSLAGLNA